MIVIAIAFYDNQIIKCPQSDSFTMVSIEKF